MENLILPSTNFTPKIVLNINGNLNMSGISIPENVLSFYKQIFDWFDNFILSKPTKIIFEFDVEYLNSASSRVIITILKKLKVYCFQNTVPINIIWNYEDEDVLETGQEFAEVSELPFDYIPKPLLN